MTKTHVVSLLKENRNERGIAHWKRINDADTSLKSFGIGLTVLRKLAKQIGRDAKLAQSLWKTDIYDAKIIGLLIDDPKTITRDQVEQQVEQLGAGMLIHVFSSCDATLTKTPFAFDLAKEWMSSKDEIRRQCAYGLLYELSKKNPKGMDDAFLLSTIQHIQAKIHSEPMWVREAMNGALLGIGKRSPTLNKAAIKAVKAIGPIDVDYGDDNQCEPIDVLKHLTSKSTQAKFRA